MLRSITLGTYGTNCYLLADEATGDALAVDCPVFSAEYRAMLQKAGVTRLKYILLTHGHFDHVCGVKELKDAFGGEICIHSADAECLFDPEQSIASEFPEITQIPCRADILLEDGDTLPFGGDAIRVMHVPGHTRGSVCYFYKDLMFSGDTLFYLSMGRTDLPGGSTKQLFAGLRAIGQIPGQYRILPGHGDLTDLAFEKAYNRYLRAK